LTPHEDPLYWVHPKRTPPHLGVRAGTPSTEREEVRTLAKKKATKKKAAKKK
jgi:hypothetical protein